MLAQFLFNLILSTPIEKKHKLKFFKFLRNLYLQIDDPIVVYTCRDKFNLDILLSHDLPFNIQENPMYSQNLGVIAGILFKKYPDLCVIDVGANIGDSVAIIKFRTDIPVLCIEGNPKFLGLLEQNTQQFNAVSIEKSFAGEEELRVKAINNLGTAYIEKSEEGIPVKTISEILENHAQFKNARLLKIDTDGFDNKVIRGSKEFLMKTKASVFFEYDPYFLAKQNESGLDIFDFFVELDYSKFIIFDNLGEHLITLNSKQKEQFSELHNYFNKRGFRYMDIWALHNEDEEIIYTTV